MKQCPSCGGQVPEDAAFCRHCGATLRGAGTGGGGWPGEPPASPPEPGAPPAGAPYASPGWSAPGTPYGPPPSPPPPPPRGGGRGLLIALIVVVLVIILLGAAAVAALVISGSERSDDSSSVTPTPATTPPEPPPTSTGGTGPTTTSIAPPAPPVDDYANGEWVEMGLSGPPGETYLVAVSDEAAVFAQETSLYVLEFANGRLREIPTEMENAGMPHIDGRQVVWWEGTYSDEREEWEDEAILGFRLPDGPRVRLADKEGSPGFPLVADGYVTWTESHPSTYAPEEIWEFPIHGVAIDADGRPAGTPDLLVPAPSAFVLGDSVWAYDLSGTHLAWENHDERSGADAGSYVRDLRSGEETHLGPDSWRPSLAGPNVAYWSEDGLYLRDLRTGAERLLDPEGDWPDLAGSYVAYLRGAQSGDSYGWEIVTVGLDDGSEEVVGTQSTPPWFGSAFSAAPRHLAYLDDENHAHIFERRPR